VSGDEDLYVLGSKQAVVVVLLHQEGYSAVLRLKMVGVVRRGRALVLPFLMRNRLLGLVVEREVQLLKGQT
jgi:hypothetical protein